MAVPKKVQEELHFMFVFKQSQFQAQWKITDISFNFWKLVEAWATDPADILETRISKPVNNHVLPFCMAS